MESLKNIRVPGVIWALLLVAAAWFLAANFPDEQWYPLILVVITALVKALEVRLVEQLPPGPGPVPPVDGQMREAGDNVPMAAPASDTPDQHRVRRWLVG